MYRDDELSEAMACSLTCSSTCSLTATWLVGKLGGYGSKMRVWTKWYPGEGNPASGTKNGGKIRRVGAGRKI